MITINLQIPELNELIARAQAAPQVMGAKLQDAMERAVTIAEEEIAERTPVDTGYLRDNISSRVEGSGAEITGVVGVEIVPYAVWVEFGTKPHEIRAQNAKALAFQLAVGARVGSRKVIYRVQRGKRAGKTTVTAGGETMIFRKRVWHPGTSGAHMFREGAVAAFPRVRAEFAAALKQVTRGLA